MSSLLNKVIAVTGGKGLLGSAFVSEIKKRGGTVITLDIAEETNLDAGFINCDITAETSIKAAVALMVEKYGRIDGWVNNAYPRTSDWGELPFEDESMDSLAANVDMHLIGYTKCCQVALNQMKKQGSGSLINMASIYGITGPDFTVYEGTTMLNEAGYAAIKGGLITLTRYLAAFYGPFNVRVNCVSPGGIFDNQNPIFVNNYEKKVPLRRMGLPEDIAPSICYLLSDDAKYVTGHNLVVDGGWTII
ncbi:NAD(P)-dependent dehydrogenase (short-subunit alcohol dehydrogenase family) [Chitinophaga dinghuensis]|uniref:NAD(P)-dependent dehydrogenase (Short-subunit alcohol dehydrogenase family) n=1 Tax=Chitinophaga dinghuensis TaxID=1539050 RepID=A0A327W8L0_9BACT|nr:SDR family oxidoreductase [Chitinophaga dinghuensis]RAJ85808.1 NAD(P)-dependent dehydrogenase (short-subunit alcohol dehydrogenase family) [Chitinophaga dinghuensis]